MRKLSYLLSLTILTFLPILSVFAEDAAPSKYGSVRLENDTTFDVPDENVEELWKNLQSKFKSGWSHGGITLTSAVEIEKFIDTYYDTPEGTLISQWTGLRHRRRYLNTGEIKELIQMKVSPNGATNQVSFKEQTRKELKFEPGNPTVVPGIEPEEDTEDLYTLIKRSQREIFAKSVAELGVDAFRLRSFLTINQERRRIYFNQGLKRIFTVTLDLAKSKKLWVRSNFTQLDIEISEITFTGSTEEDRQKLFALQHALYEEVLKTYPFLRRNQTPKIIMMVNKIRSQGPLSRLALSYGENIFLAVGVIFLFILLSVLALKKEKKLFKK